MENELKKRAARRLEEKSFEELFKTTWQAMPFLSVFFSILSVLTASGFFIDLLAPLMPFWALTVAVSLVAITIIELFEYKALNEVFRKHFSTKFKDKEYRQGQAGFLRKAVAVLAVSVCISLSLVGSYYSYKQISNVEGKTKDAYGLLADSAAKAWDAQILAAETMQKEFNDANQVKTKNGYALRVKATGQNNALIQNVLNIKAEKKEALAALKTSELTDILEGKNKTEYNAYLAVVWVFCISVCKVVCAWFVWYFDYRVIIENTPQTVKTPVIDVLPEHEEPEQETQKQIGFVTASAKRECANCKKKLPESKRKGSKYCSSKCRSEKYNKGKKY